jgi:hypothetical protein
MSLPSDFTGRWRTREQEAFVSCFLLNANSRVIWRV